MDLSSILALKAQDDKKIWTLIDKSITLKEIEPENQCILMKKGKVFTNSYTFYFYVSYIIISKVIYLEYKS